MKFIGREQELRQLDEVYQRSGFQMVVIYGRRRIGKTTLFNAFVPDYSPEDKAVCYGITGGIPKYLSMIDQEISLDENIEKLFFNDAGFFYEEP